MPSGNFTTRIWLSNGMSYTWPEQQYGYTPTTGVCFAGGGTRALSATMGQLRALVNLGLVNDINYISCVSGGSWASTAFTYYRSGATSDEQFLGPVTDPADITFDGLGQMDPFCLGNTATQNLGAALEALLGTVPDDQLWSAAVGQTFFQPFGLYDAKAPAYFSLDASSVMAIQKANPSLDGAPFHTVRKANYRLPYLVINATVDGPTQQEPYNPESLVMVSYTPLYAGVPYAQTVNYYLKYSSTFKLSLRELVGGGFIEPFAWGSGAPASPPANGTVQVPAPDSVFSLADASGTSSAAFAAIFERHKMLDGLLPERTYWPPTSDASQPALNYLFGDGGNLENYGLIPLLLRGVQRIVVFINSDTKLNLSYDPSTPPNQNADAPDIDPDLLPLFGFVTPWVPKLPGTANNQVFPQSSFAQVVSQLQKAQAAGNGAVAVTKLPLVANSWWGLPGNSSVEICWVYLDRAANWESAIKDGWVTDAIKVGQDGLPPVAWFPNYKTVDENLLPPFSLTELSKTQVNLLADLTCWVVRTNASTLRSFLSGT